MLFRAWLYLLAATISFASLAKDLLGEFPFSVRDGFIWVEVKPAQSKSPLHFILDSGASRSVIDLSVAQALKAPLGKRVDVQAVDSNVPGYWPVSFKGSVDGVALPSQYLALDLSALSGKCSSKIDGLIGLDFFSDRTIQIDFQTSTLRILKKAPTDSSVVTVSMQSRPCGLRIPVTVNGRKDQWMRVDTGCVSPLQWVAPQIRPEECLGHRAAVGLATLSLPETATDLQIDSLKIENVTTGIHFKPIFRGESGLVGLGLLKDFKWVVLDAKRHRLHLAK